LHQHLLLLGEATRLGEVGEKVRADPQTSEQAASAGGEVNLPGEGDGLGEGGGKAQERGLQAVGYCTCPPPKPVDCAHLHRELHGGVVDEERGASMLSVSAKIELFDRFCKRVGEALCKKKRAEQVSGLQVRPVCTVL
jgi:hypothetical protein